MTVELQRKKALKDKSRSSTLNQPAVTNQSVILIAGWFNVSSSCRSFWSQELTAADCNRQVRLNEKIISAMKKTWR